MDDLAKKQKSRSPFRRNLRKALKNPQFIVGLAIVGFFAFIAIFAPLLAPYDPLDAIIVRRLEGFSREHLLGTDNLGRDVLSRLMYGARMSLLFGILAMSMGAIVGIILGMVSGYFGGFIDTIIMRIVDILMAFPGLLLALGIVAVLGRSTGNVIIAVAIGGIPGFARIVRGSTLAVRKLEYIDAIRAIGAGNTRIIFRHVFPNILSPIIVQATLNVGAAVVASAALAFLGVGTPPPTPEWGIMLNNGREFMLVAPRLVILPGLMIFLLVIGINLFGNGLRDALEPKNRM